jgi:hypothetical protein
MGNSKPIILDVGFVPCWRPKHQAWVELLLRDVFFVYIEMIQDLCSARVIGTYTFLGDKLKVQTPLRFLL